MVDHLDSRVRFRYFELELEIGFAVVLIVQIRSVDGELEWLLDIFVLIAGLHHRVHCYMVGALVPMDV